MTWPDSDTYITIKCTKKRLTKPDWYLIEIAKNTPIDLVVEQLGLFVARHSTHTLVRLDWPDYPIPTNGRMAQLVWLVEDLEDFVHGVRVALEIARKQWLDKKD